MHEHGGVIGGRARTAKFATTIGTVLRFPLMFTAGAWVQVLGDAASGGWPDLKDFVIAVWTAVLGTAATRFFRWE